MMVRLGNILFHYRNFLFPVFYILLFVPSEKVFESMNVALVLGFIIAASGQAIRVATIGLVYIIRGGKNRQIYAEGLVTEGIFSHCRNPLYVGNILIIIGLGVMSNSLFFIVLMIPLFLFFYQAIVMAEENFLRNKFGIAYDDYTRSANRWIPRLKGIGATLSSMTFNWKRVIIKEYNTTYIWMTGAVLLIFKNIYAEKGSAAVQQLLLIFVMSLVILLSGYLFVRYMKKSKKWVAG
jgi:protein-S-isoprenylcysteine O-methyltransferase Ste14